MEELTTQLYLANDRPTPKKFRPVENVVGWMKPLWGLWTSTYDSERQTSAWNDLCIKLCSDGKPYRETWKQEWWLLSLKEDCHIMTINGKAAFDECLAKYGYDCQRRRFIDFVGMSNDFDAFHVTQAGYESCKEGWPHNLSLWDCESTLWFRWCFTRMERI